uniref:DNA replication complex GINS protein SLD5 isoform X2 n=2 Tax=Myxine glutinosa TaxID=7769 RepID=UPI00358EDE51
MEADLVLSETSEVEEGEETEYVTSAELIEKLEEFVDPTTMARVLLQAWLNEKFAPDLLETKQDVVDNMMLHLQNMDENLHKGHVGEPKSTIHQLELERLRFVLTSYLRSRLRKIEAYFPHLLDQQRNQTAEDPLRLSPDEYIFAEEYANNMSLYFRRVALRHMPTAQQKLDLSKTVAPPDLDTFVFLQVKDRQERVLIEEATDDQEEYVIDLEENSKHLMRYKPIAPLVSNGAVQLI